MKAADADPLLLFVVIVVVVADVEKIVPVIKDPDSSYLVHTLKMVAAIAGEIRRLFLIFLGGNLQLYLGRALTVMQIKK